MCTIFVSDITINGSICAFQPRLHRCNENVCCIRWRRLSSIDFTVSRFLSLSVSLSLTLHTLTAATRLPSKHFQEFQLHYSTCYSSAIEEECLCNSLVVVQLLWSLAVSIFLSRSHTHPCVFVCVCALHDTCIGIRKIGARLHHHMHRNSIP